jgi:hypothetical protein
VKLAEALSLRANSVRRIEQLRSRIVSNARYQEGEDPAEDATALLAEADHMLVQYETLIRRINRTNAATSIGAEFESAGICSFRLGGRDDVSAAVAGLAAALAVLDIETVTTAGEGNAARIVPGLSASWRAGPDQARLEAEFADLDLVVVENLFSLPLHLPASMAVGDVLAGRPTLVRHHDFPWQRRQFQHVRELLLADPAWLPMTVCEHSRREAAARGSQRKLFMSAWSLRRLRQLIPAACGGNWAWRPTTACAFTRCGRSREKHQHSAGGRGPGRGQLLAHRPGGRRLRR